MTTPNDEPSNVVQLRPHQEIEPVILDGEIVDPPKRIHQTRRYTAPIGKLTWPRIRYATTQTLKTTGRGIKGFAVAGIWTLLWDLIRWLFIGIKGWPGFLHWMAAVDHHTAVGQEPGTVKKGRGRAMVKTAKGAWILTAAQTSICLIAPLVLWLVYRYADDLDNYRWAQWVWFAPHLLFTVIYGARHDSKPRPESTAPRPRQDVGVESMTNALRALGILKKPTAAEAHPAPVGLADLPNPIGVGVFTRWDLPADCGKNAADVIAVAGRLAGAYASPRERFIVEEGDHESQFTIWSSRIDPFAGPLNPHPLYGADSFNAWTPAAFAHDAMGRTVYTAYPYTSRLIAARPRVGKSYCAMSMMAPAVLDPDVEFVLINLKGGETWDALRPLCSTYISGMYDEDIKDAADTLEALLGEMRARNDRIKGSKLTEAQSRDLDVPLLQVIIDEGQEGTTHPDHKERIIKATTTLGRVAPSSGISTTFITQRPDDGALPMALRAAFGEAICLQVKQYHDSNVALGASMSRLGYDASRIRRRAVGIHVPDSNNDGIPDDTVTTNRLARTVRTFDMGDDGELFADFCAAGAILRKGNPLPEVEGRGLLRLTVQALKTRGPLSASDLVQALPAPWNGLTADALGREYRRLGLQAHRGSEGRRYTIDQATTAASNTRHDPVTPTTPKRQSLTLATPPVDASTTDPRPGDDT